MSTIAITFTTQALDGGQTNRGQVIVMFNNGSTDIPLPLNLTTNVATRGFFQEVAWGQPDSDEDQASNYAFAFNRDFPLIGSSGSGIRAQNLKAVASGNTVTITATNGTFVDGQSSYTGNILVVSGFTVNNSPQPNSAILSVSTTTGGGCTVANHSLSASGTGNPWRVAWGVSNPVDVITGWDGSAQTYGIARGIIGTLWLYDSSDVLLHQVTVNSPRQLAEGDFEVQINNDGVSSDLIVNRVVTINNTGPLEYSLESDVDATTGSAYQSSNTFPGVASGEYRLFIKDKFTCEISKLVSVSDFQNTTDTEVIRYFNIMEGQSIIFSEMPEHGPLEKKNYFNTGSYNEYIQDNRFHAFHHFDALDEFIGIQFKSSYDYHHVTLHKCDDTMVDIAAIMISENIGTEEKMDCVLFGLDTGQTGVYFNAGNTYIPDTTTVLGTSIYDATTPSWAEEGQFVVLNGTGLTITGTGFDQNRGWYFIVDIETVTEASGTVQVTYNKHNYNTFEFYLNIADIDNRGFIVVEKGFNGTAVEGNPWVSEVIKKIEDTDEYLLFEWSDVKNKSDIVFQSGIDFLARIKGEFVPDSDDSSDTFQGDGNEYSIEQVRRLAFNVFVEGISFKQVMQLNIASALTGFKVNGLSLVSTDAPEKSRYGKTNLWSWRGKFGFGENRVAIQEDEIVLSVGTGVVGGGGTGKNVIPDLSGIVLYKLSDGTLVTSKSGKLLRT